MFPRPAPRRASRPRWHGGIFRGTAARGLWHSPFTPNGTIGDARLPEAAATFGALVVVATPRFLIGGLAHEGPPMTGFGPAKLGGWQCKTCKEGATAPAPAAAGGEQKGAPAPMLPLPPPVWARRRCSAAAAAWPLLCGRRGVAGVVGPLFEGIIRTPFRRRRRGDRSPGPVTPGDDEHSAVEQRAMGGELPAELPPRHAGEPPGGEVPPSAGARGGLRAGVGGADGGGRRVAADGQEEAELRGAPRKGGNRTPRGAGSASPERGSAAAAPQPALVLKEETLPGPARRGARSVGPCAVLSVRAGGALAAGAGVARKPARGD
eukprot:gene2405-biopygen8204